MRVLIVCPIGVKTGGPQALHQLCHELNTLGVDSFLVPATPRKVHAEPSFAFYNAPIFEDNVFEPDDFLIVPETLLVLSPEFKAFDSRRTFIWWLSVDNCPLPWANNYEVRRNKVNSEWKIPAHSTRTWFNVFFEVLFAIKFGLLASSAKSKHHRINPHKVHNLCQSEYAMNTLRNRGFKGLSYLSDYVEVELGVGSPYGAQMNSRIRVAYNFAKSKEQVEVLSAIDKSIDFVPLTGLLAKEVAEELKRADLFLDLGHFPGKDRLPREAILLGCPVLLARRGAARQDKDFPLDRDFLVDLELDTPSNALSKIYRIASDKKAALDRQKPFESNVLNQKETFSKETKSLIHKLEMIAGGVF